MRLQVSLIQENDLPELVMLHCRAFPCSRSTQLGKMYVRKMFEWFLYYQPKLSLKIKENEEIVGYVIGAVGGYGRKLFRFALLEILIGLLIHPRLWGKPETFTLWQSYIKGLVPKKRTSENKPDHELSAALAGIGVDPEKQGMGIGKTLIVGFENAAKGMNIYNLTLSVYMDNSKARNLYENYGWYMDNEDKSTNSAHYTKIIPEH
jgi:ribosomal protein S18 acetylase RimI-like enzyme